MSPGPAGGANVEYSMYVSYSRYSMSRYRPEGTEKSIVGGLLLMLIIAPPGGQRGRKLERDLELSMYFII